MLFFKVNLLCTLKLGESEKWESTRGCSGCYLYLCGDCRMFQFKPRYRRLRSIVDIGRRQVYTCTGQSTTGKAATQACNARCALHTFAATIHLVINVQKHKKGGFATKPIHAYFKHEGYIILHFQDQRGAL